MTAALRDAGAGWGAKGQSIKGMTSPLTNDPATSRARVLEVFGETVIIRRDPAGLVLDAAVVEEIVPPGLGAPLHRHTRQKHPGRLLTVIVPAGFERFFEAIVDRGVAEGDHDRIGAVAAEFGLEILGPTPSIPA